MSRIYLGLGSNVGDTEGNIAEALRLLAEHVKITKVSSFYETEPVGYKDQPWFLNIAAEGETALTLLELLEFTQSVEHQMKRVKTIVNGPRNIDVDILLYEDEKIRTPELTVPHPRMLERAFVLVPLLEIAPDLLVSGQRIADVLKTLNGEEVHLRT